jgi:hypothetical protein
MPSLWHDAHDLMVITPIAALPIGLLANVKRRLLPQVVSSDFLHDTRSSIVDVKAGIQLNPHSSNWCPGMVSACSSHARLSPAHAACAVAWCADIVTSRRRQRDWILQPTG